MKNPGSETDNKLFLCSSLRLLEKMSSMLMKKYEEILQLQWLKHEVLEEMLILKYVDSVLESCMTGPVERLFREMQYDRQCVDHI